MGCVRAMVPPPPDQLRVLFAALAGSHDGLSKLTLCGLDLCSDSGALDALVDALLAAQNCAHERIVFASVRFPPSAAAVPALARLLHAGGALRCLSIDAYVRARASCAAA